MPRVQICERGSRTEYNKYGKRSNNGSILTTQSTANQSPSLSHGSNSCHCVWILVWIVNPWKCYNPLKIIAVEISDLETDMVNGKSIRCTAQFLHELHAIRYKPQAR